MQSSAKTPKDYLASLPDDRIKAMTELQKTIKKNLPKGFEETMQYGMLSYVVPHKLYPAGYHCKPEDALPFLSIASQKNFIAVYHMCVYADKKLHDWFVAEFTKRSTTKLDMGKSCIRFKKPDQIPFDLIGELASKITVKEWIEVYEKNFKR
jgi:hypothetical protein